MFIVLFYHYKMNCSETVELIYTELLYLWCIYLQINYREALLERVTLDTKQRNAALSDIIRTIKLQ